MPKTPALSGEELIEIFEKIGFRKVRQSGDHVSLDRIERNEKEPSGYKALRTVVPLKRMIGPGLLKAIMREAEVTDEDLALNMKW